MNKTKFKSDSKFFNRELSWIEFNRRVLEQACNPKVPLLERVKFLAITSTNLDEFFMVRVGSLKLASKRKNRSIDAAGFTVDEQLALIREHILELNERQDRCLLDELDPALAEVGIVRLVTEDLKDSSFQYLRRYFKNEIVPSIAPIAIGDPQHFPFLKGARLCICVRIEAGENNRLSNIHRANVPDENEFPAKTNERFVLIPMVTSLPRVVVIPSESGVEYVFIEDVIGLFIEDLFPSEKVLEWTALRVTRNADFELDDDADDFVSEMQQFLDSREKSQCVRLRIADTASPSMRDFLMRMLGVTDADTYIALAPLDLSALFAIAALPGYGELRAQDWPPISLPGISDTIEIFNHIAEKDILLFHPYQSFDPVVNFLEQAAHDPSVIAIKQTLYRTSRNSKIVKALKDASENGKHVTAIVEVKARFDEERNLDWAKLLEDAGVDVVYGVKGLKVHAKLSIVVRRESTGIKRYLHFGTGNYNESTSRIYSDISFFTCDAQLGIDSVHCFNAVTGLSTPQDMEKVRMAPINLREALVELIRNEIENARAGGKASIMAKLNSLVDPEIIKELYEASNAGVIIRLNIRGICCLRPGVPGLSENIRVVSIVDRFLEHSRIVHFHHGGDQKVFITSADWMGRNLDKRVELLVPINDPDCRQRILNVVDLYFQGNVNTWELNSEGQYVRIAHRPKYEFRPQAEIYQWFVEKNEASVTEQGTLFKPIRGKD